MIADRQIGLRKGQLQAEPDAPPQYPSVTE
jgi:hypothetical protein